MSQALQEEEVRQAAGKGTPAPVLVTEEKDDEIDLLEIFRELKKRFLLILLAAVLCGGAAGAVCKFLIPPTYESTSVLYVLTKETTLASLADLQIGTQLTADYKEIITSRPVLENVIKNLGLNLNVEQLTQKLSIENPSSTRILRITAKDGSPETAKAIADSVASVASEYIADIMEMVPPKSIETGDLPEKKSSPQTMKVCIIAALIGALAVCVIVSVNVITDDSVKTAEDVQKYLEVPVLASIAYSETVNDHNRGKEKKKKHKAEKETTGGNRK